jgi:hypothetical protein
MCEFNAPFMKSQAIQYLPSNPNRDAIPPHILLKFPYALQKEHCPVCGKYLELWERKPSARTTRSMCVRDYEALIARNMNSNCFICSIPLPKYKVSAQYGNRREISNHIHDGQCMIWWTIIHNISFGDSEMISIISSNNKDNYGCLPYESMQKSQYIEYNDDSTDAEFFVIGSQLSSQQSDALPSTVDLFGARNRALKHINTVREPVMHKNKNVRFIPKPKS